MGACLETGVSVRGLDLAFDALVDSLKEWDSRGVEWGLWGGCRRLYWERWKRCRVCAACSGRTGWMLSTVSVRLLVMACTSKELGDALVLTAWLWFVSGTGGGRRSGKMWKVEAVSGL